VGVEEASELQFLARLRDSTQRYLESQDAWEAQYQRFYRVASPNRDSVSADLEPLHQNYLAARKDFQECVPRARRLCLKYGIREPWQAMLHVTLGARIPQVGATTAVGKAERIQVAKCLAELEAAAAGPVLQPLKIIPATGRRGILQRLYDYFF
jgi:hypothetical protein